MTNYYMILHNTLRGFTDSSRMEAMRRRDEWAEVYSQDVANYMVSGALIQFVADELRTEEEELEVVRQALDFAEEVYSVYENADYPGGGWSAEVVGEYTVVD